MVWEDREEGGCNVNKYLNFGYFSALRTAKPIDHAESNGLGCELVISLRVLNSRTEIIRTYDKGYAQGEVVATSMSSGMHHASPVNSSESCAVNPLAVGVVCAARLGMNVFIFDYETHLSAGTVDPFHTSQVDVA